MALCPNCGTNNFSITKGSNKFYCTMCGFVDIDESGDINYLDSFVESRNNLVINSTIIAPTITVSQVRPWVRYFARLIDVVLLHAIFAILCKLLGFEFPLWYSFIFGYFLNIICLFLEPLFLCRFGATPGKILLKTQVTNQNGSFLSFREALRRSFSVWLYGEAMYIPILLLFSNFIAYKKLTNSGMTTWDRNGLCSVQHKRIGSARVIFCIVLYFIASSISGICYSSIILE